MNKLARFESVKELHHPWQIWMMMGSLMLCFVLTTAVTWLWYARGQQEAANSLLVSAKEQQWQSKYSEVELKLADLTTENVQLMEAYRYLATDSAITNYESLEADFDLVSSVYQKYAEYDSDGVNVASSSASLNSVLDLFVDRDSDKLAEAVNRLDDELESALKEYRVAQAKTVAARAATSAPVSASPGAGYSRINVPTDRGNFVTDVISVPQGTTAVTVTGNDGNCENNCNAKPLADYVAEAGGYAGIHGSYFCPPDYAACAGKTYSYDFPVYSSRDSKWINADKLFWNGRGMAAFTGGTPHFCADASGCDNGSITAGVVNYPTLLSGGKIMVNEGNVSGSLGTVKGTRGAIGVGNGKIFLVITRSATVIDAAGVMKSLGAENALNLDGGGSAAMYYGGYKVGPGRLLPNAIVLK